MSNISNFLKDRFNPLYAVFKKTFSFDLYNHRKFIFAIIFIIIVPSLGMLTINPQSLDSQSSLNERVGMAHIFFSYLIGFAFILIYSSASLMSEEFESGTMLLLVSKPLSRATIVWGKYLALWFYSLILSIVSLELICFFAFLKHPFYDIISFFGIQFLFSLIIIFFFGTLTMGFSMLFKNAKTAALIPFMLILIIIFLFIIRPLLINPTPYGSTYYEVYQFYHFDLGYHFMNIYVWFYESFISPIPGGMIYWLVSWGIYAVSIDPMTPFIKIYTKTHFYSPQGSLLLVLIFAVVIMIIGYVIYKKRDIN